MASDNTTRPRDFVGYGEYPPKPTWPGGKKLAINFAINYEEGTEKSAARRYYTRLLYKGKKCTARK
jgi:hypothetical protein